MPPHYSLVYDITTNPVIGLAPAGILCAGLVVLGLARLRPGLVLSGKAVASFSPIQVQRVETIISAFILFVGLVFSLADVSERRPLIGALRSGHYVDVEGRVEGYSATHNSVSWWVEGNGGRREYRYSTGEYGLGYRGDGDISDGDLVRIRDVEGTITRLELDRSARRPSPVSERDQPPRLPIH